MQKIATGQSVVKAQKKLLRNFQDIMAPAKYFHQKRSEEYELIITGYQKLFMYLLQTVVG